MAISKSNYPTHFAKNFTKLPKVWKDLQAQFAGVSFWDLLLTFNANSKALSWCRTVLKSADTPRATKRLATLETWVKDGIPDRISGKSTSKPSVKKVVAKAKAPAKKAPAKKTRPSDAEMFKAFQAFLAQMND